MKALLLTLLLLSCSPARADRAEIIKIRDAAIQQQQEAEKTYVSDHLPKAVENIESLLKRHAGFGEKPICVEVIFRDLDLKLVPDVQTYFTTDGWQVTVRDCSSFTDMRISEN